MEQIHQMISAEMNSAPAGEMFVVGLGASAGGAGSPAAVLLLYALQQRPQLCGGAAFGAGL